MTHVIPPYAELGARAVLGPLRRYHRFRAVGVENVPRSGPTMLILHHSLASYDVFLIARAILEATGRQAIGLGDDNLFKVPGLRRFIRDLGIRPANPQTGREVLAEGGLLMLAPGGTREAIRPSSQARRSSWHDRLGFVRLSIAMQAPIVLSACPAADDIYRVYDVGLTRTVYEKTRWPLPLARGVGPTLLPRPVRLTGYIEPPLAPPDASADDEDAVRAFHAELTRRMAALLRRP
jgi:1-acyl-sn-glycerol-3-phosphate acyltransferase